MKVSERGRDGRIWGVGYKWEGAEEGAGGGSIEKWKRGGREVEYKGNG